MKNHAVLPTLALAAALLASWPAAMNAQPTPKPAETPKAEESGPAAGLRNKLLLVQHRDPTELVGLLRALGSGARGSTISADRDLKAISVRDYPENIATIEDALKRLDTPEAAKTDVDLTLHVLLGTPSAAPSGGLPDELREVVAALKPTLAFKGYRLVTTLSQRARPGTRNLSGEGSAELPELSAEKGAAQVNYKIGAVSIAGSNGGASIRLERFEFSLNSKATGQRAVLSTDLTLKDGEKVVVGTTTLAGQGVIVVVVGRFAK